MSVAFSSFALRSELLEAIEQVGYARCTPIQAAALPIVLAGRDVLGRARTGSGKTAVFALGVLQRLSGRGLQGLVLCPTRELAEQVAAELRSLAARLPDTRVLTLCGGRSISWQQQALERGAQVVVGTPGRVLAHIERGLALDELSVVVLDEADRMLDMGFHDEVRAVLAATPDARQTLLFSATLPERILELSREVQREAEEVVVAPAVAPASLRQLVYRCDPRDRPQRVIDVLGAHQPEQALVFCETRQDCEDLARRLVGRGIATLPLHGGMEQRDRDDAWLQLVHGSKRVLVATNVASRGLDLPALPLVVVAEVGGEPEAHVHRIGRTGRAGEEGLAVTLVASQAEERRLARIEAFLGEPIADGGELPRCPDGLVFPRPAWRTLIVQAGRKDKVRKGDVLGALIKDAGLPPEAGGRIDLMARSCGVAIAREHAERALEHLRTGRIKKRRVRGLLLR